MNVFGHYPWSPWSGFYAVSVPRTLSVTAFRRSARFAQLALVGIVLTGSWVRLTGSGLGCSDWPECNADRFVDVSSWHAAIEQINRLLTGLVAASVILAVISSLLIKGLGPISRWIAFSLVVGVLAQVVIGAYVVWTGLNPWSNMTHFLVSAVLVSLATVLVRTTDHRQPTHVGDRPLRHLAVLLAVAAGVAIVTGTVVTGSGPHAGDENAVRLGFEIREVVRIHSATVWVTMIVLLVFSLRVRKMGVHALIAPISVVLGVFVGQGFVGYLQYFTGIPAALVALHIAGSVAATVAVTNLVFFTVGGKSLMTGKD